LDFGKIPSPAEWRATVMAVTDADVQAIAREVFLNQKPAIAEIGGTE
jgi:predicted Zn-dependent peptidase